MEKEKEIEKEIERAKNIAIRYLSYRPRTVAEISKKLYEKNYSDSVVKQIIEFLMEYKYVNDKQFAIDWIKYRNITKPIGRKRLGQELYLKGIDGEIILEEIAKISDEDEVVLIKEIVEKKIAKGPLDEKETNKLFNKLLRRGFSWQLISKTFKEIV